jgi:hypothetical protein
MSNDKKSPPVINLDDVVDGNDTDDSSFDSTSSIFDPSGPSDTRYKCCEYNILKLPEKIKTKNNYNPCANNPKDSMIKNVMLTPKQLTDMVDINKDKYNISKIREYNTRSCNNNNKKIIKSISNNKKIYINHNEDYDIDLIKNRNDYY